MLRNLNNQKGFTMIELMIVVAIIGILSAIAIPNFLNFRMKAKTSEAKSNLGAIRSCEEAYHAEHETYKETTASPATVAGSFPGTTPTNWVDQGGFSDIGFKPTGKVYYQYVVSAASATAFTATATGDLDGDKATATYKITQSNNIEGPLDKDGNAANVF